MTRKIQGHRRSNPLPKTTRISLRENLRRGGGRRHSRVAASMRGDKVCQRRQIILLVVNIVLYYIISYCIILYFIVVYYIILYVIVLYVITLYLLLLLLLLLWLLLLYDFCSSWLPWLPTLQKALQLYDLFFLSAEHSNFVVLLYFGSPWSPPEGSKVTQTVSGSPKFASFVIYPNKLLFICPLDFIILTGF